MNIKRFISAILAIATAVSMTACGDDVGSVNKKEPTEKDVEQALEKLDGMTEEEAEKALEQGLGIEGGAGNAETAAADPNAPIVYEPTQEIANADFSSGLIQIGNDVFKCGGYITVGDFINQYSDRYDIVESDGSTGATVVSYDLTTPLGDSGTLYFRNKRDTDLYIRVEYVGVNDHEYPAGATFKDAVVWNVLPPIVVEDFLALAKIQTPKTFYPKGIARDVIPLGADNAAQDESIIIDFFANNLNVSTLYKDPWYVENTNTYNDYLMNMNGEDHPYNALLNSDITGINYCRKCIEEAGQNSIIYSAGKRIKANSNAVFQFYENIVSLKEPNLFGYIPNVCVMVRENCGEYGGTNRGPEQERSTIYCLEMELDKNTIIRIADSDNYLETIDSICSLR